MAIPITGRIDAGGAAEIKSLPEAKVLAVVHKGSYETLHLSYKEIFDYMMKNGLEFAGPMRELYLNDPAKTPVEELMVEIQVPIR